MSWRYIVGVNWCSGNQQINLHKILAAFKQYYKRKRLIIQVLMSTTLVLMQDRHDHKHYCCGLLDNLAQLILSSDLTYIPTNYLLKWMLKQKLYQGVFVVLCLYHREYLFLFRERQSGLGFSTFQKLCSLAIL